MIRKNMSKRKTHHQFVEQAIAVHKNQYQYLSTYLADNIKINIQCLTHGTFQQIPYSHLRGAGCPQCGIVKRSKKRLISHDDFILKANIVHHDKYQYPESYHGCFDKIIIICPIHGEFKQTPSVHLNCGGCPQCGSISGGKNNRVSDHEFIARSSIIHGDKYDYTKINLITLKSKVLIICKCCQLEFYQTPDNHLTGRGCPKCARDIKNKAKRKTIDQFIIDANKIHNYIYDYSDTNYLNNHTKINIFCLKCQNIFSQTPANHLRGNGCPQCSSSGISKIEIRWLDFLNIPMEYRQKTLKINNKNYRVDAYNPISNTVYEFYGDYWHGNPMIYRPLEINEINHKTYGQLYQDTVNREDLIKRAGYNLVFIWESDWKNK